MSLGGAPWSAQLGADPAGGAAPAPVVPPTTRDLYQQTARTLLTLGNDGAYLWEDFASAASTTAPNGWKLQNSGSGANSTQVVGTTGGTVEFSTGATASSFAAMGSDTAMIGDQRTTKWYCAFRMKVSTAIDAQAIAATGVYDLLQAGFSVLAGVHGPSSTANFCVQYDGDRTGSFLGLGVPIDTAFHIFEVWCVGDSVLHARIDGGITNTAAMAVSVGGRSSAAFVWTKNGTTAADRRQQLDWLLLAGPRT